MWVYLAKLEVSVAWLCDDNVEACEKGPGCVVPGAVSQSSSVALSLFVRMYSVLCRYCPSNPSIALHRPPSYCTCWQATSPACPACLPGWLYPSHPEKVVRPHQRVRSEDSGGGQGARAVPVRWEDLHVQPDGGSDPWDFREVILQLSGSFRQSFKEISLLPGFLTS